MRKGFFCFNILLSFVFLLTAVFPPSVFPYQASGGKEDPGIIDESKGMGIVSFKKVRCPNCGMEFYYIPGRETPHSRWVRYEEARDKEDGYVLTEDEQELLEQISNASELKKGGNLLGLFKLKEDAGAKDKKKQKKIKIGTSARSNFDKEYELRQRLTCPYDGYSFFPEGQMLEESKVKHDGAPYEEPSSIESSFSSPISFNASKDLKQFGYDLFVLPEDGKKEEQEKKGDISGKSLESLAALGMLKTTMGSGAQQTPVFSSQLSSEEAVVVPVSADYIIGPGDTLLINIWGSVQESFPVEVDREGKIMLPKSGPLYIWGMKLLEAQERITQRLNEYYTNFNVDVSMGKLRNIRVFMMGEVKKPGAYSISSQSNIFQALYKAGGPTKLGTLRKIKVISPDNKSREVDLYEFLLKGDTADNSVIQSGDTIFVPSVGDVVAVCGNVKRPGIYETKSEIPLSDVLDFAGGITPTGNLQRLQVDRVKDNERRVIVDVELKTSSGGQVPLKDINLRNGDLVMVSSIVRLKHNFVTVLGNVENPGDYALEGEMSVKDLIEISKGFMPGTYLYRAEIARVTKDRAREIIPINLDKMTMGGAEEDIPLKEWDILLVYSEAEVSAPSYVEIGGAINRPGKYELTPNMKISDLIFKAGGVTSKDFIRGAELFHIIPGEQPVIRGIGIKRVSGPNISIDKDIVLQPGDTLFVKSEPKLTERKMVTIKGEVRFPGTYPIIEGERLSDLIQRAGGYTNSAFLSGAVFNRKSIKEIQEKMRQSFLENQQRLVMEEQQAVLLRAGSSINAESVAQSVKARTEMMESIANADITGRMVVNILPIDKLKNTKYDVILEDEDSLFIPHPPSVVTVLGSVNNPTSVPFDTGKGIDYYIQKTGGLTKHADRNGIYVVHANGEAVSKFMMAKRVERGDTIVIPQEFRYWTPPGMLLKDTVEILSRIAVGVGIIAALQ